MRVVLVGLWCVAVACGRSELSEPTTLTPPGVLPPTMSRPVAAVKVLLIFDTSCSTAVTDPLGQRGAAVLSLLEQLPSSDEVLVMAFAGEDTVFLSRAGRIQFDAIGDLSASDRTTLVTRLLGGITPNGTDADATSFVAPLTVARDVIASDVRAHPGARYEVIFVSDGHPTRSEDHSLLCGSVITDLVSLADNVRLSTVLLFEPTNEGPPCRGSFVETSCEVSVIEPRCFRSFVGADSARLRRMAELGHGTFAAYTSQSVPLDLVSLTLH